MLRTMMRTIVCCSIIPLALAIPAAMPHATSVLPAPMQAPSRMLPSVCFQALRGGKDSSKTAPAPQPSRTALPMLLRIGMMLGMYGALCAGEHIISERFLSDLLPSLFRTSPKLGGIVPTSYGIVILVNVVASSFMMLYLSFIPGGARKKYTDLAKKKGDKDAEARYSLPKLYAEGFSQEAKEFNCHQRAHQQALETYSNFVACSVIGGVRQPLLTSLAGMLYIVSRVKWAKGYATGDPMNRYQASGGWGKHIWTSLLVTYVCAASTALGVAGIL